MVALSVSLPARAEAEEHANPPLENGRHWSLEPIRKAIVPEDANPVDHFIRKRLDEAALQLNSTADRHTLLRRVSLDLTGLPPTPEQIENFVEDERDDAVERMIERFLASPHYGERWGRHWLDVARYVQGSVKVPGIDRIDLAEPYRDYVVRAFNADKPYDKFLREQLAGDLLASETDDPGAYLDRITAPAFLSIGQWFEECTDPNKLRLDIIDEQISTATRAFLAHDFACARCHDHKVDPIPTRDYYALAGIFRSTRITEYFSDEWKDGRPRAVRPLALPALVDEIETDRERIDQALARLEEALRRLRETHAPELPEDPPRPLPGEVVAFEAEDFAGHKNLRTVTEGDVTFVETRKAKDRWVKFRVIVPEAGDHTLLVRYASSVPAPVRFEVEGEILPDEILGDPTFGDGPEFFRWTAIPLPDVEAGSLHLRFLVDRHVPFPRLDAFRLVSGSLDDGDLAWRGRLGAATLAEIPLYLEPDERERVEKMEARIARLRDEHPSATPTLAVADREEPVSLPVHVGGDVYRTGNDPVPRGVPGLGSADMGKTPEIPESASGRLQLAEWLAHPDHPLTARVMVNRIWHWHFGTGLVRTMDDFGRQGAPPTHPELLDWLAAEFRDEGWSVKHIHRLILGSDTYQATATPSGAAREMDPGNKLYSHYPRRRLEVEAIYDSMLSAIGKVPRQEPGGELDASRSKDRALYILTSARSPMGLGIEIRKMFSLFGFDDSGRPIHDRDESTTARQGLWWLNNPLPRYYADRLAERILGRPGDAADRVTHLYLTVLGRPPGPEAETAVLTYLDELMDDGLSESEAWSRACLGLFSTEAFQYLY